MTLSNIRRLNFPSTTQTWGMVVGWPLLVIVTLALVSAKTLAVTGPLMCAIAIAVAISRGTLSRDLFDSTPVALTLLALFGFAAVSLLWASDTAAGAMKISSMTLMYLGSILASRIFASETKANTVRLAEGMWVGFLIGLMYLTVRNFTQGGMDATLVQGAARDVITLDIAEMTRSISPVPVLLAPALLAILSGFKHPWRWILAAIIGIFAVVVVASSPHETSKLALIASAAIAAVAYYAHRWAHRLTQLAWVSACLLIIPVSLAAHSLDMHWSPWLPWTAQHRILIWNTYARLSLDRPVLGHGFGMSQVIQPEIPGMTEHPFERLKLKLPAWMARAKQFKSVHPHNAFLQVWYELGAVGAALLTIAGLAIIEAIGRQQPHQQPFGYATAIAASVLLFSSYGLWQLWLIGLLTFSTIACAIVFRLSSQPDGGA